MNEEENSSNELETLTNKMQEIKQHNGIIGYIIRGTKSASIDLKDPKKIIDYAILSSTVSDIFRKLIETLKIEEPEHTIIENDEMKLMSIKIEKKSISIFMENTVDHNKLYRKLIN